jgi:hypothetical protein
MEIRARWYYRISHATEPRAGENPPVGFARRSATSLTEMSRSSLPQHMSKSASVGLGVLTAGGALSFMVGGGPAGLVLASVCLIIGLVILVASKAQGTGPSGTPHSALQETRILVLLKDIHARPQRGGKFQEISNPNQPDLEFEVFIKCWLLSETDVPLEISEGPQLTLKTSDGSTRVGERISADLEKWRLGNLVTDQWDTDTVRAAQERMSELNITEPLESGVPREGWLHFRVRNASPSEFRTGVMELSVKDSFSCTHVGVASGPRHLPGRIWPCVASSISV